MITDTVFALVFPDTVRYDVIKEVTQQRPMTPLLLGVYRTVTNVNKTSEQSNSHFTFNVNYSSLYITATLGW